MQKKTWWIASATFTAVIISGTVASPAHAFHWFWQKTPAPAASQPANATAAAPSSTPAPAAQASVPAPASKPTATAMASDPAKADSSKVMGTLESIDTATGHLSLKTSAGKMESFEVGKSAMIFEHHKKLTLSSLKVGERVSVHYRAGTMDASKVYVIGEKKA